MVTVELGGDEKINLLQLGDLGGHLMDAAGITCSWVAGIDQDRLSGRCNNKRRAAPLHIHKVDEGEGTLGKLVNQDVLYAETTEAMKNLREIVQKINRGEGTVGMLVNDDSLFKSARATLQKVDNATETMEDQGPVSVIGLMFNGLF